MFVVIPFSFHIFDKHILFIHIHTQSESVRVPMHSPTFRHILPYSPDSVGQRQSPYLLRTVVKSQMRKGSSVQELTSLSQRSQYIALVWVGFLGFHAAIFCSLYYFKELEDRLDSLLQLVEKAHITWHHMGRCSALDVRCNSK